MGYFFSNWSGKHFPEGIHCHNDVRQPCLFIYGNKGVFSMSIQDTPMMWHVVCSYGQLWIFQAVRLIYAYRKWCWKTHYLAFTRNETRDDNEKTVPRETQQSITGKVQMPFPGKSSWFFMMTSSNGNIFRVIGLLWGEFTGHQLISLKKGQWRGALMSFFICAWTSAWVNNRDAGDLRRHRAHYDVTVIFYTFSNQPLVTINNAPMCLYLTKSGSSGILLHAECFHKNSLMWSKNSWTSIWYSKAIQRLCPVIRD